MLFDFNYHSSLLIPFVLQGVSASITLWLRGRRDESLADLLLASLLFLLTLSVMQWLLGYAGWYDAHDWHSTLMFYVPWTNFLALGPLFYAYFRALTDQQFTLRGYGYHLLPALLVVGLYALAFLIDWGYLHRWQGQPMPDFFGTKGTLGSALQTYSILFDLLGYSSLLYYGLRTLRASQAYQRYLDANFSDTERLRFNWVRRLLIAAAAALVVWLGLSISSWAGVSLGFDGWWYAFFTNGLLIYYLSFAGLQSGRAGQPALLFQPEAAVSETDGFASQPLASPENDTLAATSANTLPPDVAEWLPQLQHLMETEAPWREPELSLADLALRLRLSPNLLSRVINTGTGQHFNDFVNSFRVADAARRLRDPQFRHYTLLAIALESGFNSKSTFNRVFKKFKGLAPSEFIENDTIPDRPES